MVAYKTRVPAGFAGSVSRTDSLTIEQQIVDSAKPPKAFGAFAKLVSGRIQPLEAGDAATDVYCLTVRAYPTQSVTNTFGAAEPPASGIIDILRRGYISVNLKAGTAAKNGAVYVRVAAVTGKAVGDIEAALVANETVAVAGAYFTGPADANGVTEIAYRI
ncbi:structural cement protein Gp24 [Pseudochelatococcus contaminans]|uniref:Bacteriophage protein n=1 Tax=Pseudochelatococcus contaminans TaxID=1538103 RepID=A0A7W6EFG1_9HYPH|nr:hypothetical protein [Pseudochelatococcus contaminans]MBB3808761.1 hypothetical protein [Pseudochelatococcus contaminans]